MLAICAADKPVVFKSPKTSSKAESVSQGTKLGAKPRHKKLSTSSNQPFVSSKEATKGGSSKAPTSSKTSHSKKRKKSSSAMDSNPRQPPDSTPVDTGMHKEDQQATGGPTSLGVTSEVRANPRLSSGMSVSNLNKPIYSASFIVHSESTSGCDASADSTAEADPGLSALSDFVPQQEGMNEGTKNTSYDHLSASTDPHVLIDKTKSVSDRLETVLTQPITRKWASFIARQVEEEEASSAIKLEDLAKLVSHVQPSFKDLDSPEDDHVIIVDDNDEDEETEKDEVHRTLNVETEYTSVPKSSSPISLPTELKDLPSKLNELTGEVKGLKKQVYEFEIELPGDLKEIPTKLDDFTKNVTSLTSQVAELKTLHGEHVHLTKEHISAQKKIEEEAKAEAARRKGEMRKEELIDLLGPEVVNKYYNDKLQYDRYCDKMLNRRAKSRITNYDILTKKGSITLKVYREDDTSEIIPEFKASDLHLGEWKEVFKAYPNKKTKGWTSIYKQIQERMDYLRITKAELGIDLDRPLSE
ncbi:hypothetical protein Tco_1034813 [Tanacetum coccineum]